MTIEKEKSLIERKYTSKEHLLCTKVLSLKLQYLDGTFADEYKMIKML